MFKLQACSAANASDFRGSYRHLYASPSATLAKAPSVFFHTTCVAPRSAAFSRTSFIAFCTPTLAAPFPQPDEPWSTPKNSHCSTPCGDESRTMLARALRLVVQLDSSETATSMTAMECEALCILCPPKLGDEVSLYQPILPRNSASSGVENPIAARTTHVTMRMAYSAGVATCRSCHSFREMPSPFTFQCARPLRPVPVTTAAAAEGESKA
jgi:hypothetical protein